MKSSQRWPKGRGAWNQDFQCAVRFAKSFHLGVLFIVRRSFVGDHFSAVWCKMAPTQYTHIVHIVHAYQYLLWAEHGQSPNALISTSTTSKMCTCTPHTTCMVRYLVPRSCRCILADIGILSGIIDNKKETFGDKFNVNHSVTTKSRCLPSSTGANVDLTLCWCSITRLLYMQYTILHVCAYRPIHFIITSYLLY